MALKSVVERKADLDRHLPMIDLVVNDVTTRLDNFKPTQVMDTLASFLDGIFDSLVSAFIGSSGKFDFFIDVITHNNVTIAWNSSSLKHSLQAC